MKLHIITPVSRPWNLVAIGQSIAERIKRMEVYWHCAIDKGCKATKPDFPFLTTFVEGPKSFFGNQLRNLLLDLVQDGWVYFLDDDNVLHENFENAAFHAVECNPDANWFCFIQVRRDGRVYLNPTDSPQVGNIDMGQVVIRRSFINNFRFPENSYAADGELFILLSKFEKPVIIREIATYYNYLR